jgi:hypothetical protein
MNSQLVVPTISGEEVNWLIGLKNIYLIVRARLPSEKLKVAPCAKEYLLQSTWMSYFANLTQVGPGTVAL